MIFTISRYFGTPERIAGLFAKITHQMIRNCQMYAYKRMRDLLLKESTSSSSSSNDTKVTEEEKEEKAEIMANVAAGGIPSMWDVDDDVREEILSRCMRLNELYQAEYFEVKKSMEQAAGLDIGAGGVGGGGGGGGGGAGAGSGNGSSYLSESSKSSSTKRGSPNQTSSPKGSNSDGGSMILSGSSGSTTNPQTASTYGTTKLFGPDDQRIVFGEFDMFCRRLIKLEDLFSTIKQFQPLLASKQLEMRELVNEFRGVVHDLKKKRHDLLAYNNAQFDRDYLEFSVRYSELLDQIQHFVNRSFSETLNVRDGLDLLQRFSWMQSIERLQGDLNSKSALIFQQYGIELDEVEKLYERHKKQPPIARNLPPVAGHIAW